MSAGGEGATAREVLRHSGVEKCVMVDIDEDVCNFCKEHLEVNRAAFECVLGHSRQYYCYYYCVAFERFHNHAKSSVMMIFLLFQHMDICTKVVAHLPSAAWRLWICVILWGWVGGVYHPYQSLVVLASCSVFRNT